MKAGVSKTQVESMIELNSLYKFAKERCSVLMSDECFRNVVLESETQDDVLVKGYLQGFYEAIKMASIGQK